MELNESIRLNFLKRHGRNHMFIISFKNEEGYHMVVGEAPPEEFIVEQRKKQDKIIILWSRKISLKRAFQIGLINEEELDRIIIRRSH